MKTMQVRMIQFSFYAILALGTVLLAVLFIFPTKDTHEETMQAARAVEDTVAGLVYADELLLAGEGAELDGTDMTMLDATNQKTGRTFTEDEVRRLKVLRERFPTNSLIPRPKSAAELRAEADAAKQLGEMEARLARKTASRADIETYYDRKLRTLQDWEQLLEYVVHEENWSPAVKDRHARMLAFTPKLRERIEKQRGRSLALNGHGDTASR